MTGVCGKRPEVANLQDLLVYVTKGLSAVTTRLRSEGKKVDEDINHLITINLFVSSFPLLKYRFLLLLRFLRISIFKLLYL